MDQAPVEQNRPHALSFLDLPEELRNQIYGYTADMNDAVSQMAKYRDKAAHSMRVSKILSFVEGQIDVGGPEYEGLREA
ncbi:hypothetical protein LTS18_014747, partial [Coniosporium uncinatum]